jgi:hypothetical protein
MLGQKLLDGRDCHGVLFFRINNCICMGKSKIFGSEYSFFWEMLVLVQVVIFKLIL